MRSKLNDIELQLLQRNEKAPPLPSPPLPSDSKPNSPLNRCVGEQRLQRKTLPSVVASFPACSHPRTGLMRDSAGVRGRAVTSVEPPREVRPRERDLAGPERKSLAAFPSRGSSQAKMFCHLTCRPGATLRGGWCPPPPPPPQTGRLQGVSITAGHSITCERASPAKKLLFRAPWESLGKALEI